MFTEIWERQALSKVERNIWIYSDSAGSKIICEILERHALRSRGNNYRKEDLDAAGAQLMQFSERHENEGASTEIKEERKEDLDAACAQLRLN